MTNIFFSFAWLAIILISASVKFKFIDEQFLKLPIKSKTIFVWYNYHFCTSTDYRSHLAFIINSILEHEPDVMKNKYEFK